MPSSSLKPESHPAKREASPFLISDSEDYKSADLQSGNDDGKSPSHLAEQETLEILQGKISEFKANMNPVRAVNAIKAQLKDKTQLTKK